MSDRHFVDTNVLMYAHDAGEKHQKAKALVEHLWQTGSGVQRLSDGQRYGTVRVVNPFRAKAEL